MKKCGLFYILMSIVVCLSLLSCEEETDKINIKAFYYPIEQLKDPLVYEYSPVNNDTLGIQYWYFRTIETDTATYFTSNIYNQFFEVEQFSIEEEVSNGMIQKDYFLYAMDTSGVQTRLAAEIEYGNTFPFEVKDSSGVFLQKMKWTFSEVPLHTTTLIRNRRYNGDRKFDYKGQEYEAVEFSILEVIDDFYEGHLETKTSGVEVYAKGLGLVYQKKKISEDLILEYELTNILTMKELEQKFDQQINSNIELN